jgi:transcriptional regulator
MYLPKSFEPPDTDTLLQFLRAHSFGVLVTATSHGLDGNHLPFVFDPEPSPYGTLRGHVARANPI